MLDFSVVLFEADDLAVGVHVANEFVVFQEAEGLLLSGCFDPVFELPEAVLTVVAGLAAGLVEGGAVVAGQQLVNDSHEHAQACFFAFEHEPSGPQGGIGPEFGDAVAPSVAGFPARSWGCRRTRALW